ncbi:MAG: hypothetical protein AAB224_08275 [Gemmatimonadota bacterium]
MTDDEPFEQFVKEAAADYGAPRSEVPHEAMWQEIRARRAAAPVAPLAPALAPRPLPRTRVWMGMAATLLLGVAVGRFAWQSGTPREVASDVPASSGSTVRAAADSAPDRRVAVDVLPTASVRPARPRRQNAGPIEGTGSTTYSLVAAQHLADVEALLTSYAASPADTRSDFLLGSWAKSLLSNTRLLLDSPAARDPVRARLLADLEVILVQLVQRSPGSDAEERSAVERTLKKNQLIPRLRSAVPAGLHSGTD